jgi:uncharacterized membrane protein YraQ (UPF0718 family)
MLRKLSKFFLLAGIIITMTVTAGITKTSAVVDLSESTTTETAIGGGETASANSSSTTSSSSSVFTIDQSGLKDTSNSEEYTFGDSLYNKVDEKSFFQRIYDKTYEGVTVVQKVVSYILFGCFIICILMTGISLLGDKKRVAWYLLGMLICAILIIADLYAVDIVNSFSTWFFS